MANILEFLREVLTDADAQRAFRADPMGHLERSGFGDLTGEDVVEGVSVLRRSLPAEIADALAAFGDDDEDALPPVRPAPDETELDAAARVLAFAADQAPVAEPEPVAVSGSPAAVSGSPTAVPAWDDVGGDEAPTGVGSDTGAWADEADAADLEPTGDADWAADTAMVGAMVGGAEDGDASADEDDVDTHVVAEADAHARSTTAAAATSAASPGSLDAGALPSVAAFAESLAAVATDARSRSEAALQLLRSTAEEQAAATKAAFDETLRQVVSDAEAAARSTSARFEELIREAEADVEAIRADAEAHEAQRRAEADADRDAAREYLERTRHESDALLERARQQSDELRQRADDLLAQAHAEAEAARAEAEARRAELREAERQLRERLSGIDSLFRTVLRDDEGSEGGTAG